MLKIFKKQEKEQEIIWGATQEKEIIEETQTEKPLKLYGIPVNPKAIPGHGKIISVLPSKQGDGSTTIAANLAAVLAVSSPEKIALIDLDGYGSIRGRLGLPPDKCLVNILDWEDVNTTREMAGRLQEHSTGIMVIPGVVHLKDIARLTPQLILKMLSLLKEHYEYIILDCPPVGLSDAASAAFLVSDMVFVIIKPDRISLDMLNQNLDYLNRLDCGDRTYIILNQAGMPGGIHSNDIMNPKLLGLEVVKALPYSVEVITTNNRRELVALTRHKDDFSQALHKLNNLFAR